MENKEYPKGEDCNMCEGGCEQCGYCQQYGGYEQCGMGCQQMYGMRCGGRHHLMRWILGIIILVLVFVAGIKLGEFKENLRGNGYGYRMMQNQGYDRMPGYGMMRQQGDFDANMQYRYGMMQQGGGVQKQVPSTE